jgi:regulatory protein
MTCLQMREYLAKRDVAESDINDVVAKLVSLRFLDDYSYAETYIRSAREYKRVGPQYLRMQLKKRGIPSYIIEELVTDESEDYTRALSLARKKSQSLQSCDASTRWRRLTGFLARKGHNRAVIMQVMGELRHTESE